MSWNFDIPTMVRHVEDFCCDLLVLGISDLARRAWQHRQTIFQAIYFFALLDSDLNVGPISHLCQIAPKKINGNAYCHGFPEEEGEAIHPRVSSRFLIRREVK